MDAKNRNCMALGIVGAFAFAWFAFACNDALTEDVARVANYAKPQAAGVAAKPVNPMDAQRAYGYLLELCAFGARPSGSSAMQKQQARLEEFFKKLGANVTLQRFLANDPLGGGKIAMANIIVE